MWSTTLFIITAGMSFLLGMVFMHVIQKAEKEPAEQKHSFNEADIYHLPGYSQTFTTKSRKE